MNPHEHDGATEQDPPPTGPAPSQETEQTTTDQPATKTSAGDTEGA